MEITAANLKVSEALAEKAIFVRLIFVQLVSLTK